MTRRVGLWVVFAVSVVEHKQGCFVIVSVLFSSTGTGRRKQKSSHS